MYIHVIMYLPPCDWRPLCLVLSDRWVNQLAIPTCAFLRAVDFHSLSIILLKCPMKGPRSGLRAAQLEQLVPETLTPTCVQKMF